LNTFSNDGLSIHALHPEIRSHTCDMMTLEKGAIYGISTEEKLNANNFTQMEIISLNNILKE